jgi:hypothetical protein
MLAIPIEHGQSPVAPKSIENYEVSVSIQVPFYIKPIANVIYCSYYGDKRCYH